MIEEFASSALAKQNCSDAALPAREPLSESPFQSFNSKSRVVTPTDQRRYILWLSFACLDAPLVAISWQWLFAQTFHHPVDAGARLVLFLTAWFIYLADRLGDCFKTPPGAARSERQEFCRRHRAVLFALLVCLLLANTVCVLVFIDRETFFHGGLIAGLVVLYLAANHFALWRQLPTKETAIGFLFALGTVAAVRAVDWKSTVAFGTLCSLNCLSISVWERDLDRVQKRISFATQFPALLHLPQIICWLLAAVSLPVAFSAQTRALWLCLGFSSLLLAILNRKGGLPRDERVALADLVLLTPLLALL